MHEDNQGGRSVASQPEKAGINAADTVKMLFI
jgi:hypothetical protein